MSLEEEFRYLVSGYYFIESMDEYNLKVYVLKDVEDYIKRFVANNYVNGLDYKGIASEIEQNQNLITKLQDSLLTLSKVSSTLELKLLINQKIRRLIEEK
jgi:hypothetical protein